MKKKIIFLTSSFAIIGVIALCYTYSPWSRFFKSKVEKVGILPRKKEYKSIQLFERIKQFEDSSLIMRYDYTMLRECNDSDKSSLQGVAYKSRTTNIDSNAFQFLYNDGSEFLSINHQVMMAAYSNLEQLKKNIRKQNFNHTDSIKHFLERVQKDYLQQAIPVEFIIQDRSFETAHKITIDVDLDEEFSVRSYYLSFDKEKGLPDSMVVKLININEVEAGDEEDANEDLDYYNDFMAKEAIVTFTANHFTIDHSFLKRFLDNNIIRRGNEIVLKGNKKYDFTILK